MRAAVSCILGSRNLRSVAGGPGRSPRRSSRMRQRARQGWRSARPERWCSRVTTVSADQAPVLSCGVCSPSVGVMRSMSSDGWVVELVGRTGSGNGRDGEWLRVSHHGFKVGEARGWDGVARLGVDVQPGRSPRMPSPPCPGLPRRPPITGQAPQSAGRPTSILTLGCHPAATTGERTSSKAALLDRCAIRDDRHSTPTTLVIWRCSGRERPAQRARGRVAWVEDAR